MDIEKAILESMEEIIGIEKEELQKSLDVDLIENELLDSLGIVSLLSEISSRLNYPFNIAKISADCFRTIRKLALALEVQMKG